jgi:hypothetical protein
MRRGGNRTRSYEREDFVFEPLHDLALIEQKINARDTVISGSFVADEPVARNPSRGGIPCFYGKCSEAQIVTEPKAVISQSLA